MAAATCLFDWVSSYGSPQILVSDQGRDFKNRLVAELRRILGIKQKLVQAYMAWANGSIERMKREVVTQNFVFFLKLIVLHLFHL